MVWFGTGGVVRRWGQTFIFGVFGIRKYLWKRTSRSKLRGYLEKEESLYIIKR